LGETERTVGMPRNAKDHRTKRYTEWRPRGFGRRFGSHGGAAIGELIVRLRRVYGKATS